MERINLKCKDCNKPFSISIEEQKWLRQRGFHNFKRCSACRGKAKNTRQPQVYNTIAHSRKIIFEDEPDRCEGECVPIGDLVINYECQECHFENSVLVTSKDKKVTCPICNTVNDFWMKNEKPPKSHKEKKKNKININIGCVGCLAYIAIIILLVKVILHLLKI